MFLFGAHDWNIGREGLMTPHGESHARGGNYDDRTSLPWYSSHRER